MCNATKSLIYNAIPRLLSFFQVFINLSYMPTRIFSLNDKSWILTLLKGHQENANLLFIMDIFWSDIHRLSHQRLFG